jgi:hypothetical protein
MTLDRARNRARIVATATSRAPLSQLVRPTTGDVAVDRWMSAVQHRLEAREGLHNPFEKAVTARDLVSFGLATEAQVLNPAPPPPLPKPPSGGGIPVANAKGGYDLISVEAFANSIRETSLFKDLMRSANDPSRFDELPAQTRKILLTPLAEEARKRGADIRRLDERIQSVSQSFAQTVTEVTAAVAGAQAGIRQVQFAQATANRSTAGQVTQVTARLDDFDGGGASVEETLSAVADRTTGLEAKYTLKLTAGGAIAGFGIALTNNTAGPSSAFIIQADKFAVVSSSYAGGLDTTPDVANIPFGVDSDGAYVGGNLKVSGKADIDGTYTKNGYDVAMSVNTVGNSETGILTYGRAAGNAGVIGIGLGGGAGVWGTTTAANSVGVKGSAVTNGIAAEFNGTAGGIAMSVTGPIRIASAQFASGTATATINLNTKPGSNAVNTWLEVYQGTTRGWIPWVPDV